MRRGVAERTRQLVEKVGSEQIIDPSDLPDPRRSGIGQYRARRHYWLAVGDERMEIAALHDANAGSVMVMWHLSRAAAMLPPGSTLRASIEAQLHRARRVPLLFQGSGRCRFGSAPGAMGWYPLVDGFRRPAAATPSPLLRLVEAHGDAAEANLADGDIWSWVTAIERACPGLVELAFPLDADEVIDLFDDADLPVGPGEVPLIDTVSPRWAERPAGTYFLPIIADTQHFSCCVTANMLAVLLGTPAETPAMAAAARFVDRATRMALDGELPWMVHSYDYAILDNVALAYTVRAHDEAAVPILGEGTLEWARQHAAAQVYACLDHADLHRPSGSRHYAALVFAFHTLTRLGGPSGALDAAAEALCLPNDAAGDVVATGPFPHYAEGPLRIEFAFSSPATLWAPLVEAFVSYAAIGADHV